jgi:hypothetical protein
MNASNNTIYLNNL